MRPDSLALAPVVAWPIVVAGMMAIFATYWDEAFHTDVGRDSAFAAPHVLLYGSVAVVGFGVASWGVKVLMVTRSLSSTLRHLPLLAAGLGGLGALVAAPVDAVWHTTYGRDAVLWSPPHILVVFAAAALTMGVMVGVGSNQTALRTCGGVLLLANAVTVVFEYEADVPQFSEVLYLPLLLVVGLAAAGVISRTVPGPAPVAAVIIGYVALRLVVVAGLTVMDRSTPDLPIAILGLAAYDLPLRSRAVRMSAAAVATAGLAAGASAAGVASPGLPEVALGASIVAGAMVVVAALYGRRRALFPLAAAALLSAVMVLAGPEPAEAHDPGQGDFIAPVRFVASSDGRGAVVVRVVAREHCPDLVPRRVVARRAGMEVSASLNSLGECSFQGEVEVDPSGRWFVYAEFEHESAITEAWLPIDSSELSAADEARPLYRADASNARRSPTQVLWGGLIYASGFGLLLVGCAALRNSRREPTGSARDLT